jgi:hypothetical protein
MTTTHNIKKVSEYLALGGLTIGMLLETPVGETEKAFGFTAVKFNSYGNPYNGVAWLPKSQLKLVENDHYTNGPKTMFLCPTWLYSKNFA